MLNAKNGRLSLNGGTLDYIVFGSGPRPLILIPGVGDGFKTVKDMALPFAFMYRKLAEDFTVYVFSRRNELRPDTTTRDMAEELSEALKALEIGAGAVVGVSQGGMIAQWLAIDHPEQVRRLVLTVTMARPNPTVREAIGAWMEMAKRGDYQGIMLDTAERSYSPQRLRKARAAYRLLGRVGQPKSFERFMIQAASCLNHDASGELQKIACPTLVIGGEKDGIVTGEASRELKEMIPGSQLYMYPELSHGLYEEAPDFLDRVKEFCKK